MSNKPGKSEAVGKMLLDLYRPRFELQFAHHPKRAEIVEMLCQGDNPPELVDLWFAEAEMYTWEALSTKPIRGAVRQPVKFAIVKGED